MTEFYKIIAAETGKNEVFVKNVIQLLEEGATIPFIARYRKEMTGSMNEVEITMIRDRLNVLKALEKRRESILSSLAEMEKLSPELEKLIREAPTLSELEDIYLPYRPKRKTKASAAREKGLEPLAKWMMLQLPFDIEKEAQKYISEEKGVESIADALSGARDIMAEWVSEHLYTRKQLRRLFAKESLIYSKLVRGKQEEAAKYRDYWDWSEPIRKIQPHRTLAIFRGENEGFLNVKIFPEKEKSLEIIERNFIKGRNASSGEVRKALTDAYDRLLQPTLETEMRNEIKIQADHVSIKIFSENLRQLLLAPPLGRKRVLAIDPGFRTGCKIVCLDSEGNLLHNETIYPHPPQKEKIKAASKIKTLVNTYKIEAIAIGNGTASRETEDFIRRIEFERDVVAIMVNESGASIYSASPLARAEFPDYDITVRSGVSIGRRLQDPLAELVKIDPKSIGVGQYQHDVDQNLLADGLKDVVESCVNKVGVELNTASPELLTYISGIGPALAKAIIEFRNATGTFTSRKKLLDVPRFGKKAFEQSAGFLRIKDSEDPLDNTAVHPESYHIVEKMAATTGCTITDLMKDKTRRQSIDIHQFITDTVGLPTLQDIMNELEKPGRDPRDKIELFSFNDQIRNIGDIQPGMILPGIVVNITRFGAFVDLGVHTSGLIHVSEMADHFVSDPTAYLKLNQKVQAKVLTVDIERQRINLSLKGVIQ